MWHGRATSISFCSDNLSLLWKNCENKSFSSYQRIEGRDSISLESVFNDKTYYPAVSQRKTEDVPNLMPRKKRKILSKMCTNWEHWILTGAACPWLPFHQRSEKLTAKHNFHSIYQNKHKESEFPDCQRKNLLVQNKK